MNLLEKIKKEFPDDNLEFIQDSRFRRSKSRNNKEISSVWNVIVNGKYLKIKFSTGILDHLEEWCIFPLETEIFNLVVSEIKKELEN